ncbi:MAG: LamG domain-containing protein [Pseudomonadota bacterium]
MNVARERLYTLEEDPAGLSKSNPEEVARMKTKKLTAILFCFALALGLAGVAEANLIAYYSFEGNAGNGTVYGATPTSQGYNGSQAYYFDGVDDNISIPLNINPGFLTSLTMGAWVKAAGNGTGPGGKVISHDDGGYDRTLGLDYRSSYGGNATGRYNWSDFAGNGYGVLQGPDYRDAWDFIAAVYTPTQTELYVNGQLLSVNSVPGSSVYTNTWIGSNKHFNEYFQGTIDDVFFYDEALTKPDLDAMMAASHPVPIPGAIWLVGSGLVQILAFRRRRK